MNETWPAMLSQRGAHIDAAGDVQFEPPTTTAPASVAVTPLLREASILVRGEDAEGFLQGQLSSDIKRLSPSHGQLAAYCTPKGRVLATFFVWPHAEGYILRLPLELAGPIIKRLRMYVLRSRVMLDDISENVALLGLSGSGAVPLFRKEIGSPPGAPYAVTHNGPTMAMALPGDRIEIALPRANAAELWDRLTAAGGVPTGRDEWDRAAIEAGLVTVLPATSDQFIPQMLNLELAGAVSFDKGCYPGQEIVARTQYRGTVKRRLQRFASPQAAQPGAAVVAADGSAGGIVVSAARARTGGYELLAVASREDPDSPLRLTPEGAPLQRLPLPYELASTAGARHDGD